MHLLRSFTDLNGGQSCVNSTLCVSKIDSRLPMIDVEVVGRGRWPGRGRGCRWEKKKRKGEVNVDGERGESRKVARIYTDPPLPWPRLVSVASSRHERRATRLTREEQTSHHVIRNANVLGAFGGLEWQSIHQTTGWNNRGGRGGQVFPGFPENDDNDDNTRTTTTTATILVACGVKKPRGKGEERGRSRGFSFLTPAIPSRMMSSTTRRQQQVMATEKQDT